MKTTRRKMMMERNQDHNIWMLVSFLRVSCFQRWEENDMNPFFQPNETFLQDETPAGIARQLAARRKKGPTSQTIILFGDLLLFAMFPKQHLLEPRGTIFLKGLREGEVKDCVTCSQTLGSGRQKTKLGIYHWQPTVISSALNIDNYNTEWQRCRTAPTLHCERSDTRLIHFDRRGAEQVTEHG